jgi:hypothetical protein
MPDTRNKSRSSVRSARGGRVEEEQEQTKQEPEPGRLWCEVGNVAADVNEENIPLFL